jgi:hypothetical protein
MTRAVMARLLILVAFAAVWAIQGPLLEWRWRRPTWVEFLWGLGVGVVVLGLVYLGERFVNRSAKPS